MSNLPFSEDPESFLPPVRKPSFAEKVWASFKSAMAWIGTKLLGPIGAAVVVVIGVILVSMGFKELQIGGVLAKLLGKKKEGDSIDVANSVDKDRVGPDGKIIAPGTPDSKGDTQAVVVPIQEPGLFSNPKTIKFTPPGEEKPIEVVLPDGVKNKDVDQVIVVKPDVIAVTVRDGSGVPASTVNDLLKKYSP